MNGDSHVSDIIGVYEQKLRAQKTRETHLDDLVQAKTMALSQADRLIQQYKSRLAQVDADVCISVLLHRHFNGVCLLRFHALVMKFITMFASTFLITFTLPVSEGFAKRFDEHFSKSRGPCCRLLWVIFLIKFIALLWYMISS